MVEPVVPRDTPWRRNEAGVGILSANTRLDGGAAFLEFELRQGLAPSDANLELNEVDARDCLGNPVLYLKTRIHLEEVELSVAHEELDRSDIRVTDLLRYVRGRMA